MAWVLAATMGVRRQQMHNQKCVYRNETTTRRRRTTRTLMQRLKRRVFVTEVLFSLCFAGDFCIEALARDFRVVNGT